MTTQTALFGDDEPQPVTAPAAADQTNDLSLVADAIRTAIGPGYLLQDQPGGARVLQRDPTRDGIATPADEDEARAVEQLLSAGLLRRGGNHQIRYGTRRAQTGPAASVLVPGPTRAMLRRWDALHPIATSIPKPRPAPPG